MTKEKYTPEEISKVLKEMRELVEVKIAGLKSSLPVLFTVISAVFAYFIVQENADSIEIIKMYMAIIILTCASFGIVLFVFKETPYYNSFNKIEDKSFRPYDIKTYWNLPDIIFVEKLEEFFGKELNSIEKLEAKFLKQRINEYRLKYRLVKILRVILLSAAIVLGGGCLIVIVTWG